MRFQAYHAAIFAWVKAAEIIDIWVVKMIFVTADNNWRKSIEFEACVLWDSIDVTGTLHLCIEFIII